MAKSVFETNDLTARIITSLERIGHHISGLLKAQAMEHGISPLQIRILIFIYSTGKATKLGVLSEEFALSKATLSVALKSMEQKKLIARKIIPDDQRSFRIELTEWGRQIAHVAGFYPEPLRRIIAPMANAEKEALWSNINGILHKLTEDHKG